MVASLRVAALAAARACERRLGGVEAGRGEGGGSGEARGAVFGVELIEVAEELAVADRLRRGGASRWAVHTAGGEMETCHVEEKLVGKISNDAALKQAKFRNNSLSFSGYSLGVQESVHRTNEIKHVKSVQFMSFST